MTAINQHLDTEKTEKTGCHVMLGKHLNYFQTKSISNKIKGTNLLTRKGVSQTLFIIKDLPELV